MANNYGEYLEEQKKQQSAPAAPQAAPTTVQAVDGYGKFLETLANNKRIENTPTNAKTYADYLTYIGQDPIGDYNAKVRKANLDYAKGLATYGQAAEKMAKSGMTGSGYGEYLQGLAYQGKQSAVGAAQKEAQAAMKQTFSGYGEHLEGVKGTNEQNAINGIVSGLLEGDAAKAYARQQGVTEDRLEQVLAQTSGTVSAAKQQKLADATSAVTSLMGNGQSIDAAIASLNGVYDKAVLDQVKANLQKASAQQAGATINTATGVTDFKAGLDEQLGSGAISMTDYDMQLVEGSDKNREFFEAILSDPTNIKGMEGYIERLAKIKKDGTVKKSGAEVWAEMSDNDKTKQITEWADELHASGNLTTEDYNKFFAKQFADGLREDTDNAKELLNWRESLATDLANGRISQKQHDDLMKSWNEKVLNDCKTVTDASIRGENGSTTGGTYSVTYTQGDLGKEKINLTWSYTRPAKGAFKSCVSSNGIQVGVCNGKVAIKLKDGGVYEADYPKTKDNSAFVAWLLTQ